MAVGKYTSAEDRREVISVIVRTILGIITTFLLLSWFSGGFPFHLSADMFLSRSFLTAFLCFWAVFAVGYLLFSRVELWKIMLTNFCLGIAVPILRAALFFVFLSFHAGFLMYGGMPAVDIFDMKILGFMCISDLVMIFAANLVLYLKCSKTDNVTRSFPAAFGVYILALLAYLSSNVFFNF